MRYVVLIIGLLGVAASCIFGFRWGTEWREHHEQMEKELKLFERARSEFLAASPADQMKSRTGGVVFLQSMQDNLTLFYTRQRMLPFILAGIVLGLIGVIVSFNGHGLLGALLLVVIGAGPAIFDPKSLIITGCFLVAGFFSVFVRPRRPKEPAPVDDLDEMDPVEE